MQYSLTLVAMRSARDLAAGGRCPRNGITGDLIEHGQDALRSGEGCG